MKNWFLLVIGSLILLFACTEQGEDSPILVFLKPSDINVEANSKEHILITFEAYSEDAKLTEMVIDQSDDYFGFVNLVDSGLQTNNFKYILDYVVPEYPDSTVTLLTFSVVNENGDEAQIAKTISVNKSASFVEATSGHVIYSGLSEKQSCFNLYNMTPVYLEDSVDFQLDFVELTDSLSKTDDLSYDWGSRSGISFVKFNGFNYAQATSVKINEAYGGGVKTTKITNIADDDIFLFGRNNVAFGALQIVVISDPEGTLNDKYVFNLKMINGVPLELEE
ncbi:hypothetical protein N6H18_03420 [Reichenbachiella agarivorans]|uniref:Calx-beta domain-containing protein n=1 Tax=Reichenbachiella agarivorans TaxID=2979464 RepID=A0ABY6CR66_9BACT|nr:hypothetical protein [Reichenbachiella agarivorans]UXP33005.1 hypothetical protein N6H18_03420 [Reichenbachiella agarivorans]